MNECVFVSVVSKFNGRWGRWSFPNMAAALEQVREYFDKGVAGCKCECCGEEVPDLPAEEVSSVLIGYGAMPDRASVDGLTPEKAR